MGTRARRGKSGTTRRESLGKREIITVDQVVLVIFENLNSYRTSPHKSRFTEGDAQQITQWGDPHECESVTGAH